MSTSAGSGEAGSMSDRVAELEAEVERLREAIRTHRGQKADDRCVEDDDRLYAVLGDGIKCDRRVGSKFEMALNCMRFLERRCQGGYWPSYVQVEADRDAWKRQYESAAGGRNAAQADLQEISKAFQEVLSSRYPTYPLPRFVRETLESVRAEGISLRRDLEVSRRDYQNLWGQLDRIREFCIGAIGNVGVCPPTEDLVLQTLERLTARQAAALAERDLAQGEVAAMKSRTPVDHPVLDKITSLYEEQSSVWPCGRLRRESDCCEFWDPRLGSWFEIVVRAIAGPSR